MGKKRKKTPKPASVVESTPQESLALESPPAAASQPALTEEKAAELVAEAAPPPAVDAELAAAQPEPEPAAAQPEPEPAAAQPEPEPSREPAAAAVEAAPAASEALPETVRPKKKKKVVKKKKRASHPPAVTRAALDEKIDQLEAKLEVKKEEAAKAAREGFGSNPAIDDTSVPPIDLEIHDEFFAAGERASMPKEASGSFAALDPRHAQKMTAHARARRAHLSRYVKWAVGAAAGILLLGITIKTFRGRPNDEPVRHVVAHVSQPVEQPALPTPPEKLAAQPAPQVAAPEATTDEAKPQEAKPEDSAKPEASATPAQSSVQASAEPPKDMPPEKPKNAWQEKQTAKAALERGANGAAVAAGERSVALDPTDGEAWLVLGAAYQALGNVGQAKRCYQSCVARGRKGPISDCRDMLHSL